MARRREEESTQILERVRDLIGKGDRRIAKRLIFEGIFVPPKGAEKDDPAFLERCRRTVNNYRTKIREGWKTEALPKPGDPVGVHEFIASCSTRIDDLDGIIESSDTKSTAKINAYGEIRQLMTLIAKARGVPVDLRAQRGEGDPEEDGQVRLPFLGVFADLSDVPAEVRERIRIERKAKQGGGDAVSLRPKSRARARKAS